MGGATQQQQLVKARREARQAGRGAESQEATRQRLMHEARMERKPLPLDYMLRVMRDTRTRGERRDRMAIAAAPYIHARLIAHKIGGPDGGAIPLAVSARVYVFLPDNRRRVIDVTPTEAPAELTQAAVEQGGASLVMAALEGAAVDERDEALDALEEAGT